MACQTFAMNAALAFLFGSYTIVFAWLHSLGLVDNQESKNEERKEEGNTNYKWQCHAGMSCKLIARAWPFGRP
jgi:hypothetical protein